MAGRGPAPKMERRNKSDVPLRGEWQPAPGVGWQHGDLPAPPGGLLKVSRDAWAIWMGAWFAANWTPDDLPGLRRLVKLYDDAERDKKVGSELRLMMDTYGVTPKGQRDNRWLPPKEEEQAKKPPDESRYRRLRVVGE